MLALQVLALILGSTRETSFSGANFEWSVCARVVFGINESVLEWARWERGFVVVTKCNELRSLRRYGYIRDRFGNDC